MITALLVAPALADPTPTGADGRLDPIHARHGDWFGYAVAYDGDTAVVGAPRDDTVGLNTGAVHVFERDLDGWRPVTKILGVYGDLFGEAVDVDGDLLVAGAPYHDGRTYNSGGAFVYRNVDGEWVHETTLLAPAGTYYDGVGRSVAVHGDLVVVGAPYTGTSYHYDGGNAHVWRHVEGEWVYEGDLLPADVATEHFGHDVAIHGDTIVVGEPRADESGLTNSGRAHVFAHANGTWTLVESLTSPVPAAYDQYGHAVAYDGDLLAVGAPYDDTPKYDSGTVYAYRLENGTMAHLATINPTDAYYDRAGVDVAVAAGRIVIGIPEDDDQGFTSGSVAVAEEAANWTVTLHLREVATTYDRYGYSVDVTSEGFLAGAWGADDVWVDAGIAHVTGFDSDGDGLVDADERHRGTDPLVTDTDADGVDDGAEVANGTNPLDRDTDDDGYSEGAEAACGSNPLDVADNPATRACADQLVPDALPPS